MHLLGFLFESAMKISFSSVASLKHFISGQSTEDNDPASKLRFKKLIPCKHFLLASNIASSYNGVLRKISLKAINNPLNYNESITN